jgi:pseudouridine synthase
VRSPRRLYPVGRLDADTTGLILLTNDGELADRLTHPRYGVNKVYRARIQPARLSPRALEGLREGVNLDDGRTAPAQARQPAAGVLELTIREGRKRQVRRMVEAVGHRVVELERVAFGPLGLRGLEPGKSRRLTQAEVERLRRLSEPRAEPGGRAPARRAKPGDRSGGAKPGGRSGGAKPGGRSGGAKPGGRSGGAKPRDRAAGAEPARSARKAPAAGAKGRRRSPR